MHSILLSNIDNQHFEMFFFSVRQQFKLRLKQNKKQKRLIPLYFMFLDPYLTLSPPKISLSPLVTVPSPAT